MIDSMQFYAILEKWRDVRFSWKDSNCCHFVADCLRAWDIDFAIREFSSASDAADWLSERKAETLRDYLTELFGEPQPPLQGGRGWIAYRSGQGLSGASVGVVDRKAIFVGDKGLVHVRIGDCDAVFNPANYRG